MYKCLYRPGEIVAGFEWDEVDRDKCRRHGVSVEALESVFRRPMAVFPDPAHSATEVRSKGIGSLDGGRRVFVVFTLRERDGERYIRPISARYMHSKEVEYYENEVARAGE